MESQWEPPTGPAHNASASRSGRPLHGATLHGTVKSQNAKGVGFIISEGVGQDIYFASECLHPALLRPTQWSLLPGFIITWVGSLKLSRKTL